MLVRLLRRASKSFQDTCVGFFRSPEHLLPTRRVPTGTRVGMEHPMNAGISLPLTPRLRHCHDFQQVAIRVLKIEATATAAGINLAVRVIVWPTPVGEPPGLHPAEDRLEVRLTDMEGIVMALGFWIVGEVKGQALIDLHLREVALARLHRQAENFGEKLG